MENQLSARNKAAVSAGNLQQVNAPAERPEILIVAEWLLKEFSS
jgi:hypothetical protein